MDLVGEARPREGEPRREVEKASSWAVKSKSKFVVSFALSVSLRERRGVGEGVRAVRRTVEGVICARARGVGYRMSVMKVASS